MKKNVWLKWDGSYDLNGIYNHRLTPLVGDNPIKAIKERLYLLGFDCGKLDDELSQKTKEALVTFNGYCNHPTIHRRPSLPDTGKVAPRKNVMPNFQLTDFPSVVEMNRINLGELLNFNVDVGADADKDTAWGDAPCFDGETIKCLKELFPESVVQAVQPGAPSGFQMFINRLTRPRQENTVTLNAISQFAVKIVSTPESISPFLEYAGIKIEINGFEKVKSLMMRIYRSFDANTDETSIPGERIIYQEILNEAEIKALSTNDLVNSKGKQHEARAHMLKQQIGGGLDGSFGIFYGLFYERIDAPYKVRVWISETEDFFNDYKPAGENDTRKFIAKTDTVIGYMDTDAQLQVRRLRSDALDDEPEPPPNLAEPNVDHIKTVHDKSNIALQDLSEPAIVSNWKEIPKGNSAVLQAMLWTEKDEIKINVIEKICADHNKDFLRNNQFKREAFSDEFKAKPLETYWAARKKLDDDGENFQFAKLKDVFDNTKRHINLIKRRICCGQWSHLEDTLKTKINQTLDDDVLTELVALEGRGYPYKDSLFFLNKFMSFFSYIVYKAVDEPEYNFYANWGIGKATVTPETVRDRRAKIRGGHMIAMEPIRYHDGAEYINCEPQDTFHIRPKPTGSSVIIMGQKITELMAAKGRTNVAKVILVPSYNDLNVHFFNRVRAVPMFMQGMLDMQFLIADEICQTPIGFMEHDSFHVASEQVGGGGTQQWQTLYNRLCELMADPHNRTEREVYQQWQNNLDTCTRKFETFGDEKNNKRFCLEFLMFFMLHEPALKDSMGLNAFVNRFGNNAAEIKTRINNDDKIVVTPEASFLRNRLRMGGLCLTIMKRLNYDFFGPYANDAVPHLRWGFMYLHRLSMYLNDLDDDDLFVEDL